MSKSSSSSQSKKKKAQAKPQPRPNQGSAKKKSGAPFFASIVVFMLVFLFMYGFFSRYYNEPNILMAMNNIPHLMMETVFVLLGFGLFLTSSNHGKLTGITTALFVVSFNYLIGVLLQELWFIIFFNFENTDLTGATFAPNAQNFWNHHIKSENVSGTWVNTHDVTPSYLSFRLANLCSISYLVGMIGYNGKVGMTAFSSSLILFNVLFYLNFYLNALLSFSTAVKDTSFRYLDDYGTYLVYLFGGVYGIVVSNFTKNNIESGATKQTSILSSLMKLLGSFFLFATFIFTSTGIIDFVGMGKNYKFNAQAMIILFSLVSSIIGNFIGCALLNKGFISIESIAIGALPGGIIVGALAGQLQNFGAATIVGLVSGLFTAIWMIKIHPKINKKSLIDTHGLLGPILIISFIGTFIIPSSTIIQYYWKRDILPLNFLNGESQQQYRNAQYQLAYFAVTLGIALVTGVVIGIFSKKNDSSTDFSDTKIFVDDFGLYQGEEGNKQSLELAPHSQQNFQVRDDVI